MSPPIGRRRFLKSVLLGGGAAAAAARIVSGAQGIPGPPPSPPSAPAKPAVFRARREGMLKSGAVDTALIASAAAESLSRALGEAKPVPALRRIFKPSDVVGIKVNTIAGRGLSSRPELVLQIAKWLQEAGVPARSIVIWDRTDRELSRCGYALNSAGSGVRVIGTNEDYDWKPREWGPNGSCFARILTQEITALINVGVLKDHELAGVAGGMKSWYGAIHNPNKCHDDGCYPYVAHLAAYPLIREKLRLTILDASIAQCQAGPGYSPRWAWPCQSVIAGTDPVAVDAVAWKMIEERRKEVGLPTLASEKREPRWIGEAVRLGLGEADLSRIRLEDV